MFKHSSGVVVKGTVVVGAAVDVEVGTVLVDVVGTEVVVEVGTVLVVDDEEVGTVLDDKVESVVELVVVWTVVVEKKHGSVKHCMVVVWFSNGSVPGGKHEGLERL
jgi:hypothetical protein